MALIDFDSIPETLVDLIYSALEHGVASVAESGGPLIPFLLVQNGEDIRIHRFDADELVEGIAAAENFARELEAAPEYFVIAFDGYLTVDDRKDDAIYVKGFAGDERDGYVFAQRYIPASDDNDFQPYENVAYVDNEPNPRLAG